jgi:hypothetical protein
MRPRGSEYRQEDERFALPLKRYHRPVSGLKSETAESPKPKHYREYSAKQLVSFKKIPSRLTMG